MITGNLQVMDLNNNSVKCSLALLCFHILFVYPRAYSSFLCTLYFFLKAAVKGIKEFSGLHESILSFHVDCLGAQSSN